jgi:DNA invertase Pin-like site-specific DNA recombinase
MRVGYARVSTTSEEQLISLEMQVTQLQKAACAEVISESVSAYKGERPGWTRLRYLVACRQVTEVIVVDQSRLARDRSDQEFLDECSIAGVVVRTTRGEVIENQSVPGLITTSLISLMNQVDSRMKSIKVSEGVKRRRAAGYLATGKLPFGYMSQDSKAAPDPQNWEAARAMFDQLIANGMNISGWIRETGMPWTPVGVRKWLRNPMLRGCVQGQWGEVTPLISGHEYDQAERLLALRTTRRGKNANTIYLFSGLVRCEGCSKALHNVRDRAIPRLKCKSPHCGNYGRGIRVSQVREQVIQKLTLANEEMAELAARDDLRESAEAIELRAQIAQLEQLQDQGVPGLGPALAQQKAQLAALTVQPAGPRREMLGALFADPATLQMTTDEELRPIVIEFIEAIVWLGGLESLRITLR